MLLLRNHFIVLEISIVTEKGTVFLVSIIVYTFKGSGHD